MRTCFPSRPVERHRRGAQTTPRPSLAISGVSWFSRWLAGLSGYSCRSAAVLTACFCRSIALDPDAGRLADQLPPRCRGKPPTGGTSVSVSRCSFLSTPRGHFWDTAAARGFKRDPMFTQVSFWNGTRFLPTQPAGASRMVKILRRGQNGLLVGHGSLKVAGVRRAYS